MIYANKTTLQIVSIIIDLSKQNNITDSFYNHWSTQTKQHNKQFLKIMNLENPSVQRTNFKNKKTMKQECHQEYYSFLVKQFTLEGRGETKRNKKKLQFHGFRSKCFSGTYLCIFFRLRILGIFSNKEITLLNVLYRIYNAFFMLFVPFDSWWPHTDRWLA